jgi:hypothetical protein
MLHIDADNNAPAVAPAAAANVGAVYAATVKLPDFWQHNPRSWFFASKDYRTVAVEADRISAPGVRPGHRSHWALGKARASAH